jgi:hypothetical protein
MGVNDHPGPDSGALHGAHRRSVYGCVMLVRFWLCLAVLVLAGGCQCFVAVNEDAGLEGTVDASTVDAGTVDAGTVDASTVDASVLDAGSVDAVDSDAGQLSCATVRCSPWTRCFEDAGAVCVPTVTALRWVVPVFDAAVPLDTIRLAVAVEVMGEAESIPVTASGAGQSTMVATRSDAGLAMGSLSFTTLDAGRLLLVAGWSGGPQASTVVNVLPTRAIEIIGPNPPSHGVNTPAFEPNDPDGNAWRRDDVVAFRSWPRTQVVARHDHPDASVAVIDAGVSCDGGCSSFGLQDVEFNAFRGEVELRAVSDAGWEARGERLPVTRWRWRRVVAGVPNPIAVQTPVMAYGGLPFGRFIMVGTEDTRSTGRLVALDEEGFPTPSWIPQGWSAAVTAPVDGCWQIAAGSDGDAGFLWLGQGNGSTANVIGERYVLVGGGSDRSVAVTDRATVVTGNTGSPVPFLSGRCGFDGGTPSNLLVATVGTLVTASSGELCAVVAPAYFWEEDAGATRMLSERVFPHAGGGYEWPTVVTTDGRLTEVRHSPSQTQVHPFFDAGVVDTLVMGIDWYLFTASPEVVRATFVPQRPTHATFAAASGLRSRVLSPPVFRALTRPSGAPPEGLLYAVGQDRRLSVIATVNLTEAWSWAPDAGLSLSAPMGFAPSSSRLGSLLLPVNDSVLSVVADGCHHRRDRDPLPPRTSKTRVIHVEVAVVRA